MKKILIIEDDAAIAAIERDYLEMSGYAASVCPDGASGLAQARSGDCDLILLDLMLPGPDGFTICRKLRGQLDIPILMVTAKREDIDKIRGLGLGADDYIIKPFSPSELVARVKSNLAQYQRLKGRPKDTDELTAGSICIHTSSHRVYINGSEIGLKKREYELLAFLAANADMVFSKEALNICRQGDKQCINRA